MIEREKLTLTTLKIIEKYITIPKNRALVVGCSYGYEVKALYDYGFKEVTGIDISNEAINLAKKLYSSYSNSFVLANVENMPFKNESFDFVYAADVLEHTHDPRKALTEIWRVLKNGYVYVRVPNTFSIQLYHLFPHKRLWLYIFGHEYECPDKTHISELPAYRWEQLFTDTGFNFIRLKVEDLYIRGSSKLLRKPLVIKKPFILQYNLHYILQKRL